MLLSGIQLCAIYLCPVKTEYHHQNRPEEEAAYRKRGQPAAVVPVLAAEGVVVVAVGFGFDIRVDYYMHHHRKHFSIPASASH